MTQEQIFELVMQFGAEVAIKVQTANLPENLPMIAQGVNF